jgi:rubrerythrin
MLGGEPNMKVPEVPFDRDPMALIRMNVEAEQDAADTYAKHIEAIPNADVRRLLERIRGDELYHKGEFLGLLEKIEPLVASGELEIVDLDKSPDKKKQMLWRFLQEDVSGEYNAILRYLHQSFTVEDGWLADNLEDRAIDEMRHMAWVAEEIVESGGEVDMVPDPVTYTKDLREIFTGNAKLERAAEDRYQRHIDAVDDDELRELWGYIQFQEKHHAADFEDQLSTLSSEAKAVKSEEPKQPEAEPAEAEPAKEAPKPDIPRDKKPTVGSLFRKK